jgi:hypothetical protein
VQSSQGSNLLSEAGAGSAGEVAATHVAASATTRDDVKSLAGEDSAFVRKRGRGRLVSAACLQWWAGLRDYSLLIR